MRYRLILFFCLFGFSALADFSRDSVRVVRCIDTEEFDTTWEYSSTKYRNTYDVNNLLIAQEVFTNTSGSWVDSVLFNYSYDAQGRRIVSLYQIFSGGNWVNQELDSTLFLINGSLSLTSNYSWAGSWLPLSERIEWTYNVLDSLVLKQVQHANGNSWENYTKNEITWNPDGKITASVNSSWQSNAWVFTDMIYNWYDMNGNDSLSVNQYWSSGSWIDGSRTIYQTDVMGNDSIIISQNWSGTSWEDISKHMLSWDTQGRLLSDTTAYFTTGYWIYSALITHIYGSNSRTDASFTYNALTMQFIPDSKEEYFFYPSGVVESKIVHEDWSPDGAWVFWRSYYYNPDGQIAGSSSTCIGCGYYDDSYFYNNFGYLIAFEYGATTHGGIQSGERCDYYYTGLNGNPAICNSGTTVLTADSAVAYLWNTGATTQQITVSQPGIYQCDVTYADGLVLSTAPVNVEIIPADIVNSNSDSTIVACEGFYHVLSLPYYSNCSYKWYQTKHSTGTTTLINLYSSPNELTIYPTTDTTTYFCIILSPCGNDTSSKTTLVDLGPAPQISFLPASGNFCQGSSLDLSAVATGAVSYLWSTGDTTQSISITSPAPYYYVQITFSSGCTSTAYKFLTAVPGAPHPEISQNGSSLLALYNASASVQWYRNDTLITGATSSSYTPSASGNYTVVFTNSNGCSSTSDVYHFDPNAFIAEAGTSHHICPGDSMLLGMSANTAYGGTPGYQYLWTPSQGLSNTAIATPYAHPIQTTTYTLTVTDTLGQIATDVITVTIDSLPDVTVTSSTGVLDYCIPNSSSFSAEYNSAYTYRWYMNNQVISQYYAVGVGTPGIYHVLVTNSLTGCSNRSADINVVGLTGLSGVSIYTTGSTIACGGTGVQLYALADSAVSYQWYSTYTGILTGETDSILSNVTTPNFYYVIARAGNGCPSQSTTTYIQSDTTLMIPPVSASANTFCNTSVIDLTVDSMSGYSYQWYLDGVVISGADSNHVSTSISGQFTVQCTNASGCHGSASHYVYDIHDPDTLEIVQSGAELEAIGNSLYYQWYLNGNPIPNSNTPTYHPTQPGVYTVGTSFSALNEICSSISLPFVVNCVASWQTVNLGCNHQCIGEINLTTGGSSNYSLQWSNGSTDSVLTNLCLGSYIFHLTDSNGCDITDTINIGDTNPITLYTDQTNVSCKDYCDGYLTLMAEGGWGIYQYYMNGVSCSNE